MMDNDDFDARMATLKGRIADMPLSLALYNDTRQLLGLIFDQYDDFDPSMMDAHPEDFAAIIEKFETPLKMTETEATITLSMLDIFEIEKACLVTEGFYDVLGGADAFVFSKEHIRGVANSFEDLRDKYFSEPKAQAVSS